MAHLRIFTGVAQIILSLIMLAGLSSNFFLFIASSGFAVMMTVAIGVRLNIKDPLLAKIPAIAYLAISLFLVYISLIG